MAPGGPYRAVGASDTETCGITTDGALVCWSGGRQTVRPGTFTAVDTGESGGGCALREGGALLCWGPQGMGRAPAGSYLAVSAGAGFACALRADHAVRCWGDPSDGETTVPVGSYRAVAAASGRAFGVTGEGRLLIWGIPNDGDSQPAVENAVSVAAGWGHAVALDDAGGLHYAGGDASWGLSQVPEGAYTAVTTGASEACAERTDGTWLCWIDDIGERRLEEVGSWAALDIGGETMCGIRAGGELACLRGGGWQAPPDTDTASEAGRGAGFEGRAGLAAAIAGALAGAVLALRRRRSLRARDAV